MSSIREQWKKYLSEEACNVQLHDISAEGFVKRIEHPFEEACDEELTKLERALIENGEDEEEVTRAFSEELRPLLLGEIIEDSSTTEGVRGEKSGLIGANFHHLLGFISTKLFHVPAHIPLPDDACRTESQQKSRSATLAETRKLYNEILQEKQRASHLDTRLAELKELKARLTGVNQY